MKNVWCVRAEFGTYTRQFVNGGYVGIGYGLTSSLANVTTDLLVEHWDDLPVEFRDRLGFRIGLIRA